MLHDPYETLSGEHCLGVLRAQVHARWGMDRVTRVDNTVAGVCVAMGTPGMRTVTPVKAGGQGAGGEHAAAGDGKRVGSGTLGTVSINIGIAHLSLSCQVLPTQHCLSEFPFSTGYCSVGCPGHVCVLCKTILNTAEMSYPISCRHLGILCVSRRPFTSSRTLH